MSNKWTDEDKARLIKAAKLYENQWVVLTYNEFKNRGEGSINRKYSSLKTNKWAPPKGTLAGITTFIEEHPEQVLAQFKERIKNHNSRCFIPEFLKPYDTVEEKDNIPKEATPEEITETNKLERKVIDLQDRLMDEKRKLKQAHRDETVTQVLANIMRQELKPLDTVSVKSKSKPSKATTLVHGVAILSDEHADHVVDPESVWGLEHYDFDIFRCRLDRWAKVVAEYCTVHLPRHHFEHLWIFKLGDSVQGDIHNMKHRNHFRNSMVAAIAIGDAEAQAFDWIQRKTGITVSVICVPGNHGRTTIKVDNNSPHDNYDYLVGTQIATRLLNNDRIQVLAPASWTAFVNVLGHVWAINHGHGVRGFAGFPWYGFDRKAQRIQSMLARKKIRVDYFTYGHYHTDTKSSTAGAKSLHNGAWYLTDPYAIEQLSVGNTPQQNFYVVDEEYGLIQDIPIYVTSPKNEDMMLAGKHTPMFGRDIIIDVISPPTQEFTLIENI